MVFGNTFDTQRKSIDEIEKQTLEVINLSNKLSPNNPKFKIAANVDDKTWDGSWDGFLKFAFVIPGIGIVYGIISQFALILQNLNKLSSLSTTSTPKWNYWIFITYIWTTFASPIFIGDYLDINDSYTPVCWSCGLFILSAFSACFAIDFSVFLIFVGIVLGLASGFMLLSCLITLEQNIQIKQASRTSMLIFISIPMFSSFIGMHLTVNLKIPKSEMQETFYSIFWFILCTMLFISNICYSNYKNKDTTTLENIQNSQNEGFTNRKSFRYTLLNIRANISCSLVFIRYPYLLHPISIGIKFGLYLIIRGNFVNFAKSRYIPEKSGSILLIMSSTFGLIYTLITGDYFDQTNNISSYQCVAYLISLPFWILLLLSRSFHLSLSCIILGPIPFSMIFYSSFILSSKRCDAPTIMGKYLSYTFFIASFPMAMILIIDNHFINQSGFNETRFIWAVVISILLIIISDFVLIDLDYSRARFKLANELERLQNLLDDKNLSLTPDQAGDLQYVLTNSSVINK